MSALYDERNERVYVPMALDIWNQLRYGWSEPVQVRVTDDELIFRSLKPAGHLYATDDDPAGSSVRGAASQETGE